MTATTDRFVQKHPGCARPLYHTPVTATAGYLYVSGAPRKVPYALIGAPMPITTPAAVSGPTFFFAAGAGFSIIRESVPGVAASFPSVAGVFYSGSYATAAVGSAFLPACPFARGRCPACPSAPGGVDGVILRLAERLVHGNVGRLGKAA